MHVVDSSVWLEVATEGELADQCMPHLEDLTHVVTPAVVLFEVYRVLRRRDCERCAMAVAGEMEFTTIVPADSMVAIAAADLSRDHDLTAVDAIIYATARLQGCPLVTADADFRGLTDVILIEPGAPAA